MTTNRAVRYRCELYARLTLASGVVDRVRVLEVSEGGAFIEAVPAIVDLQVGDHFELALGLPGGAPWQTGVLVSRHGSSRREVSHAAVSHLTVAVPGIGVEFDELTDDALEQLRDFLELLDNR